MDRMLELSPRAMRMILVALHHYEGQMDATLEYSNRLTEGEAADLSNDLSFVRSLIAGLER
jgi:hypothetical protein